MAKFPRAGILTLLLALTATLLVPASASASWQNGSDAAIYPLAVCRDGIRFLFAADWVSRGRRSLRRRGALPDSVGAGGHAGATHC